MEQPCQSPSAAASEGCGVRNVLAARSAEGVPTAVRSSLLDSDALPILLRHPAMLDADTVCRLICVSSALGAAVEASCRGLVSLAFAADDALQRAAPDMAPSSQCRSSALVHWLARRGGLLRRLQLEMLPHEALAPATLAEATPHRYRAGGPAAALVERHALCNAVAVALTTTTSTDTTSDALLQQHGVIQERYAPMQLQEFALSSSASCAAPLLRVLRPASVTRLSLQVEDDAALLRRAGVAAVPAAIMPPELPPLLAALSNLSSLQLHSARASELLLPALPALLTLRQLSVAYVPTAALPALCAGLCERLQVLELRTLEDYETYYDDQSDDEDDADSGGGLPEGIEIDGDWIPMPLALALVGDEAAQAGGGDVAAAAAATTDAQVPAPLAGQLDGGTPEPSSVPAASQQPSALLLQQQQQQLLPPPPGQGGLQLAHLSWLRRLSVPTYRLGPGDVLPVSLQELEVGGLAPGGAASLRRLPMLRDLSLAREPAPPPDALLGLARSGTLCSLGLTYGGVPALRAVAPAVASLPLTCLTIELERDAELEGGLLSALAAATRLTRLSLTGTGTGTVLRAPPAALGALLSDLSLLRELEMQLLRVAPPQQQLEEGADDAAAPAAAAALVVAATAPTSLAAGRARRLGAGGRASAPAGELAPLLSALAALPMLRELTLSDVTGPSERGLDAADVSALSVATQLTFLALCKVGVDGKVLAAALSPLTRLRALGLDHCPGLDECAALALARALRGSLSWLSLCGSTPTSDEDALRACLAPGAEVVCRGRAVTRTPRLLDAASLLGY